MKRASFKSAFTILEVTIAAFLAAILILGVLAMSVSSNQIRNTTAERDIAREAAHAKLEEIIATDFDSIQATFFLAGDHFFSVGTAPKVLISSVPGEEAGKATLTETATAAEPNIAGATDGMKKVTVEIRWRSDNNSNESFKISSYVVSREAN